MPFEFRLPDIGEGVAEGEVVQWFVKEGETIREDAPLVSVLTDKANVEIPSPKAGRIAKIHAQVGEKVKVGGLLVTIDAEGGAATVRAPPTPVPAAPAAPAAGPSPVPGATVSSETVAGGRTLASPYLRRIAAERGIDLSRVRGSGPGGRIMEADLTLPASSAAPSSSTPASETPRPPSVVPPSPAVAAPSSADVAERIPIRGLRRAIAEHMAEASHRAAHYTYVEEIDVTELVQLRDRMAKHVEKQGARLSYLPFIVKAVVAGLKAHPRVNSTMDDATNELVRYGTYNIGIATAAPDGLLVPVIHHAETKSVVAIAKEIQELSEKGRAGKLSRAELTGGTFTISSLGALGGVLATPILNYPEVAILGVHRISRRPVYRTDGTIGPADLMNLSISLDHRVLDGVEGAQFLATVKAYLEDPHQLFAEMA
ncbi:MAG: dihydrolipoamide acetyltransferase family protein [Thermoplasmata archaeon]